MKSVALHAKKLGILFFENNSTCPTLDIFPNAPFHNAVFLFHVFDAFFFG